MSTNVNNEMVKNFVVLENDIAYDWDDYGVWGAVLYGVENKSITTIKYGHGRSLEDCLGANVGAFEIHNLGDAVSKGLVSEDEIKEVIVRDCIKPVYASNLDNYPRNKELNLNCEVIGGRKIKGSAFLSKIFDVTNFVPYGYGRNGSNGTHTEALVAQSSTGKVANVKICYININVDNYDEMVSRMVKHPKSTVGEFAHIYAYDMSYSACDIQYKNELVRNIFSRGVVTNEIPEEIEKMIA